MMVNSDFCMKIFLIIFNIRRRQVDHHVRFLFQFHPISIAFFSLHFHNSSLYSKKNCLHHNEIVSVQYFKYQKQLKILSKKKIIFKICTKNFLIRIIIELYVVNSEEMKKDCLKGEIAKKWNAKNEKQFSQMASFSFFSELRLCKFSFNISAHLLVLINEGK